MKFVYILIAIIIGVGAVYLLTNTPDTTTNSTTETEMNEAAMTETEMTSDATTEVDTPVTEVETDVSTDTTVSGDAEAESDVKVFDVSGINFAFDVEEIRVQEGDTVTINFESAEGFHDWVVDEFDAATAQVRPGEGVTSVTFVADEAGTYEYYCSVGSHRANGMVGTLIVE